MFQLRFITFLMLITTTFFGCRVFYNVNRIVTRDAVLLTQDDLHRMGLGKSNITRPLNDLLTIKGFQQRGSQLTVQYWLFNSSAAARKAAEKEWVWFYAAPGNFQPEQNPEDVIGDATWRNIHRSPREWENDKTDIIFVKHNLLVSVRAIGHGHLQYARDIAQHIDTKIEVVLKGK